MIYSLGGVGVTVGFLFTNTMPKAPPTSATNAPCVTGSFNHHAPITIAKTGVRNTNTLSLVAG